jgi:carboxypeptidase Taq
LRVSVLEQLRGRAAELADLGSVEMLLGWDQLVMMPHEGSAARAQQLATLARLHHERATGAELGSWLDELEGVSLEGIDADMVRLARRDWGRARRVPEQLAVELASASAEGQDSWQAARGG